MSVNAAFWDLLTIKHLTPARETPEHKQTPCLSVNRQHMVGLVLFYLFKVRGKGALSR